MVKLLVALVVAPPVKVAYLGFICVCIELVTPDTLLNSASVTVDTVTLPPTLEITALLAVKPLVAIIIAAPVMVACLILSKEVTSLVVV